MIIDISPTVCAKSAVFPGDVPYERTVALDVNAGDPLTLSAVRSTVHIGAHVDAPNHYLPDGRGIDAQPLELYYGPCDVVRVVGARGRRLTVSDMKTPPGAERVLFATETFPDPNVWNDDFASLSPELIDWLNGHGVRLVGIDTPSVDPATSKALESHSAVARHDMAILEGVVLNGVSPGRYTLAAFPIKLSGADASPVRAVLIRE